MLDIHSQKALELFGEVTPETRRKAKTINYFELYGGGQIGLSLLSGQYPPYRSSN